MKVAIIGVGLIGGSLALKLREKKFANEFSGLINLESIYKKH
jgi:prephenate dehydrogenase